jgi:hypothetical protein
MDEVDIFGNVELAVSEDNVLAQEFNQRGCLVRKFGAHGAFFLG